MKKLFLTGVAVLLLLIKPAFASNALKSLDVLAYIFFGIVGFGLLGIVFTIVAFRTDKTVWKILAAIPTIALLVAGFFVMSAGDVPLVGMGMMALAVVNIVLITNARKRKVVNPERVAAP